MTQTQQIKDGPVWCDGCGAWCSCKAEWAAHRETCPHRDHLVDACPRVERPRRQGRRRTS